MSEVNEHISFLHGLFDETSESGERCNEIADILSRLRADLAQRTAERDEARRDLCNGVARRNWPSSPHFDRMRRNYAAERGWDCFDAKEVKQ